MSRREASDADLHGFQPVDPWGSEDVAFTRRNLPHLEVPGATYFVTFRCCSKIALAPEARALVITAIQACDRRNEQVAVCQEFRSLKSLPPSGVSSPIPMADYEVAEPILNAPPAAEWPIRPRAAGPCRAAPGRLVGSRPPFWRAATPRRGRRRSPQCPNGGERLEGGSRRATVGTF